MASKQDKFKAEKIFTPEERDSERDSG